MIHLGLPKGSLQGATLDLFRKAGFNVSVSSRSYYPTIDDDEIECLLVRAQEMARYVEKGLLDVGLTGLDWIIENGADVEVVSDLAYSKTGKGTARWVLAVPNTSPIQTVQDLQGQRIATEVTNLTRRFLAQNNVEAEIEFSWGATEVKPPYLADAIVEITETGNSLRANKLRIIETVLETNTKLIANKQTWADEKKRRKIEQIAMLLEGVIEAVGKVGILLNAPKDKLAQIVEVLPSLHAPTISNQTDPQWVALTVVAEEKVVRDLIPQLKGLGAQGIVEFALNKVIP